MLTLALLPIVAVTLGTVPPRVDLASAPKSPLLTVAEIFKRLESSPVAYAIKPLSDATDVDTANLADLLWPQAVSEIELPIVVTGKDGGRSLKALTIPEKAAEPSRKAEELFAQKDYAGAIPLYEAAAKACPDCYIVWANLGDCHLFQGDASTALKMYEKAIALNPDDYRLWFYKSNALRHLGRAAEMREAFIETLVLKPHYALLTKVIQEQGEKLGLSIRDERFKPRGFARRNGEGVEVFADVSEGPAWLAFAACKALWIGEPSHRKDVTGSEEPGWSSREEAECLAALLTAYESSRQEKKAQEDLALDRLTEIAKGGLLNGFVLYELGARVHPHVTLLLAPEHRKLVRDYVRRYVLVPR